MICPHCNREMEPRLEDGTTTSPGLGGKDVKFDQGSSWECPICDAELDSDLVADSMPEPDFDCPELD